MKTSLIMALILVLLLAFSCGSGTASQKPPSSSSVSSTSIITTQKSTSSLKIVSSTAQSQNTSKSTRVPSPSILIMSPESGFVSETGDVTITVKVLSFDLVEQVGQTNVHGVGHIIFYLDVEIPKTTGAQATTAPGTYTATAATSYTWHGLKAGHHMLRVQLVNNDNTPLSEPVFASVGIDVKQV